MPSAQMRLLFLIVTGDEFPDANEDRLRALGEAWDTAGRRLGGELGPALEAAVTKLRASFTGEAAQAFTALMTPFIDGEYSYLTASAGFFHQAAGLLRELALDVEYMKYVVILELAMLDAEATWAMAISVITGPLPLIWLASRSEMTRKAIHNIITWVKRKLHLFLQLACQAHALYTEMPMLARGLLTGITLSMGNQMLVTAGAQAIQFNKGTRTHWNTQYLQDSAVVGTIGGALAPLAGLPAAFLAKQPAGTTRQRLKDALEGVFNTPHHATDWHKHLAHSLTHIGGEFLHEGLTATLSTLALTHQFAVNWADFTAGASSGITRTAGHLFGHIINHLTLTIRATVIAHKTHRTHENHHHPDIDSLYDPGLSDDHNTYGNGGTYHGGGLRGGELDDETSTDNVSRYSDYSGDSRRTSSSDWIDSEQGPIPAAHQGPATPGPSHPALPTGGGITATGTPSHPPASTSQQALTGTTAPAPLPATTGITGTTADMPGTSASPNQPHTGSTTGATPGATPSSTSTGTTGPLNGNPGHNLATSVTGTMHTGPHTEITPGGHDMADRGQTEGALPHGDQADTGRPIPSPNEPPPRPTHASQAPITVPADFHGNRPPLENLSGPVIDAPLTTTGPGPLLAEPGSPGVPNDPALPVNTPPTAISGHNPVRAAPGGLSSSHPDTLAKQRDAALPGVTPSVTPLPVTRTGPGQSNNGNPATTTGQSVADTGTGSTETGRPSGQVHRLPPADERHELLTLRGGGDSGDETSDESASDDDESTSDDGTVSGDQLTARDVVARDHAALAIALSAESPTEIPDPRTYAGLIWGSGKDTQGYDLDPMDGALAALSTANRQPMVAGEVDLSNPTGMIATVLSQQPEHIQNEPAGFARVVDSLHDNGANALIVLNAGKESERAFIVTRFKGLPYLVEPSQPPERTVTPLTPDEIRRIGADLHDFHTSIFDAESNRAPLAAFGWSAIDGGSDAIALHTALQTQFGGISAATARRALAQTALQNFAGFNQVTDLMRNMEPGTVATLAAVSKQGHEQAWTLFRDRFWVWKLRATPGRIERDVPHPAKDLVSVVRAAVTKLPEPSTVGTSRPTRELADLVAHVDGADQALNFHLTRHKLLPTPLETTGEGQAGLAVAVLDVLSTSRRGYALAVAESPHKGSRGRMFIIAHGESIDRQVTITDAHTGRLIDQADFREIGAVHAFVVTDEMSATTTAAGGGRHGQLRPAFDSVARNQYDRDAVKFEKNLKHYLSEEYPGRGKVLREFQNLKAALNTLPGAHRIGGGSTLGEIITALKESYDNTVWGNIFPRLSGIPSDVRATDTSMHSFILLTLVREVRDRWNVKLDLSLIRLGLLQESLEPGVLRYHSFMLGAEFADPNRNTEKAEPGLSYANNNGRYHSLYPIAREALEKIGTFPDTAYARRLDQALFTTDERNKVNQPARTFGRIELLHQRVEAHSQAISEMTLGQVRALSGLTDEQIRRLPDDDRDHLRSELVDAKIRWQARPPEHRAKASSQNDTARSLSFSGLSDDEIESLARDKPNELLSMLDDSPIRPHESVHAQLRFLSRPDENPNQTPSDTDRAWLVSELKHTRDWWLSQPEEYRREVLSPDGTTSFGSTHVRDRIRSLSRLSDKKIESLALEKPSDLLSILVNARIKGSVTDKDWIMLVPHLADAQARSLAAPKVVEKPRPSQTPKKQLPVDPNPEPVDTRWRQTADPFPLLGLLESDWALARQVPQAAGWTAEKVVAEADGAIYGPAEFNKAYETFYGPAEVSKEYETFSGPEQVNEDDEVVTLDSFDKDPYEYHEAGFAIPPGHGLAVIKIAAAALTRDPEADIKGLIGDIADGLARESLDIELARPRRKDRQVFDPFTSRLKETYDQEQLERARSLVDHEIQRMEIRGIPVDRETVNDQSKRDHVNQMVARAINTEYDGQDAAEALVDAYLAQPEWRTKPYTGTPKYNVEDLSSQTRSAETSWYAGGTQLREQFHHFARQAPPAPAFEALQVLGLPGPLNAANAISHLNDVDVFLDFIGRDETTGTGDQPADRDDGPSDIHDVPSDLSDQLSDLGDQSSAGEEPAGAGSPREMPRRALINTVWHAPLGHMRVMDAVEQLAEIDLPPGAWGRLIVVPTDQDNSGPGSRVKPYALALLTDELGLHPVQVEKSHVSWPRYLPGKGHIFVTILESRASTTVADFDSDSDSDADPLLAQAAEFEAFARRIRGLAEGFLIGRTRPAGIEFAHHLHTALRETLTTTGEPKPNRRRVALPQRFDDGAKGFDAILKLAEKGKKGTLGHVYTLSPGGKHSVWTVFNDGHATILNPEFRRPSDYEIAGLVELSAVIESSDGNLIAGVEVLSVAVDDQPRIETTSALPEKLDLSELLLDHDRRLAFNRIFTRHHVVPSELTYAGGIDELARLLVRFQNRAKSPHAALVAIAQSSPDSSVVKYSVLHLTIDEGGLRIGSGYALGDSLEIILEKAGLVRGIFTAILPAGESERRFVEWAGSDWHTQKLSATADEILIDRRLREIAYRNNSVRTNLRPDDIENIYEILLTSPAFPYIAAHGMVDTVVEQLARAERTWSSRSGLIERMATALVREPRPDSDYSENDDAYSAGANFLRSPFAADVLYRLAARAAASSARPAPDPVRPLRAIRYLTEALNRYADLVKGFSNDPVALSTLGDPEEFGVGRPGLEAVIERARTGWTGAQAGGDGEVTGALLVIARSPAPALVYEAGVLLIEGDEEHLEGFSGEEFGPSVFGPDATFFALGIAPGQKFVADIPRRPAGSQTTGGARSSTPAGLAQHTIPPLVDPAPVVTGATPDQDTVAERHPGTGDDTELPGWQEALAVHLGWYGHRASPGTIDLGAPEGPIAQVTSQSSTPVGHGFPGLASVVYSLPQTRAAALLKVNVGEKTARWVNIDRTGDRIDLIDTTNGKRYRLTPASMRALGPTLGEIHATLFDADHKPLPLITFDAYQIAEYEHTDWIQQTRENFAAGRDIQLAGTVVKVVFWAGKTYLKTKKVLSAELTAELAAALDREIVALVVGADAEDPIRWVAFPPLGHPLPVKPEDLPPEAQAALAELGGPGEA